MAYEELKIQNLAEGNSVVLLLGAGASKDYGFPLTDEDFEYTWNWFNGTREFWKLAAQENRYVLFTADQ